MGDFLVFLLFRRKIISVRRIIAETSGTDQDRLKIQEVLYVCETDVQCLFIVPADKNTIINKAQEEVKGFLTIT